VLPVSSVKFTSSSRFSSSKPGVGLMLLITFDIYIKGTVKTAPKK
jgi:hypothetical protein